jgi:flagellar hook-basal body complex protein FliE
MDTKGIDQMLSMLRASSGGAGGRVCRGAEHRLPGGTDFAQVLQNSIAQVNQTQQQAEAMAANFAAGNSTENLHEVMIALQKANISFPGNGSGTQQARLGLPRRDEHAGLTPLNCASNRRGLCLAFGGLTVRP